MPLLTTLLTKLTDLNNEYIKENNYLIEPKTTMDTIYTWTFQKNTDLTLQKLEIAKKLSALLQEYISKYTNDETDPKAVESTTDSTATSLDHDDTVAPKCANHDGKMASLQEFLNN